MRATPRGSVASAVLVAAVLYGSALAFSSPPTRVARLEAWLAALDAHQPGSDDRIVADIASWPVDQIRTLWIDVSALVHAIRGRDPDDVSFKAGEKRPARTAYTGSELGRLRALARMMRQPGAANRILKRGALLHTDIAIMSPQRSEPLPARAPAGPWRIMVQTADGRSMDLGHAVVHWDIAKLLLELVAPPAREPASEKPDPARDSTVRDWHRATLAYALREEDLDPGQFARAVQLFPDDGPILFFAACAHETFAAAHIQSALRSIRAPVGATFDIDSDKAELRQAEPLFRRAVAADPAFAEARVRFGRVLGQLGRHADAVAELRQAVTLTTDPPLLYYVNLFLAAEHHAIGDLAAARASYDSAAALFPAAQSPHLGRSQLARRAGDRAGALAAIQEVFAAASGKTERTDDPWWTYYGTEGRVADALLAELRKPFLIREER